MRTLILLILIHGMGCTMASAGPSSQRQIWTSVIRNGSGKVMMNTSGSATIPNAVDTLVGRATTDTLTNKSLTAPLVSGGTFSAGTFSGLSTGAVINSSGVLASEAQLAISRGGTGQSTAQAALDALLPSQGGNSGQFLTTNGTNGSWGTVAGSPLSVSTLTTNSTATTANDIVIIGTGGITTTLYTAAGNSGKFFRAVKTSLDSSASTLDPNGAETINGSTTYQLKNLNDSVSIFSDGSNWLVNDVRRSPTTTFLTTAGTGAYVTPVGVRFLKVRLCGAGGSGGSVSADGNSGTDSLFSGGEVSLTGGGGSGAASGGNKSAGGTASGGDLNTPGQGGQGGGGSALIGGNGGSSPFGGAGNGGGNGGEAGGGAAANSCSGGGGGSVTSGRGGGGAGGYVEKLIYGPTSIYSYTVGTKGAAVTNGGAGGDGLIVVEENY